MPVELKNVLRHSLVVGVYDMVAIVSMSRKVNLLNTSLLDLIEVGERVKVVIPRVDIDVVYVKQELCS